MPSYFPLQRAGYPHHTAQLMATLAVSLGPFAAGLGKGYISPAIASLEAQQQDPHAGNWTMFGVTEQQKSWVRSAAPRRSVQTNFLTVASLSLLGALFGGLIGGLAMQFGRRNVILVTSLPFCLSWVLTVVAPCVEVMFVTAFVAGLCCAIVVIVSQVYISEISVPDIRGCLSAVLKVVGYIGTLLSVAAGAYLDWRQLALLVAVAPLLLFVTTLYMPETPNFLVLAGRDEEARAALEWLRETSDVGRELASIRASVTARARLRQCKQARFEQGLSPLARPIFITCGLMFFQRFSGVSSFNSYAVSIFGKTFGSLSPHGGAVAVAFVQLLASMLSGLLVDSVGRLPLLIASSVIVSVALAAFGSYTYYQEFYKERGYHTSHLDWIPLLCILALATAFSLGISPVSWLLLAELFPLEHRGFGSAIASSFSYLCAFISVKTFVDLEHWFGLHGAFWLYSTISIAGLWFVLCFVPETKGLSLFELENKTLDELQGTGFGT